ncbi:hypothetical protein BDV38DRAFT_235182 [Aspergillus pseudotamarii]|uniref:Uncharacterized protein n=1 Tax=Aspergillus pseudotamarii TaxID=132259 RepID=A0A5N6T8C7_ASPPS|nr:uncharacterized protein BDV38DRAFT_235182 [Aspergillus pseudotamarii]KAE8142583.1 hypothetical protein BDV38DRAFT_235182 [Aspergillus pseudotamarii]
MIYITSSTDTFTSSILIYILQCLHTVLARAVTQVVGFNVFWIQSTRYVLYVCMNIPEFRTDVQSRRGILHYATHSIFFLIFSISANSRYPCKQIVILLQ